MKLWPSKQTQIARAGCSCAGRSQAFCNRLNKQLQNLQDLQPIKSQSVGFQSINAHFSSIEHTDMRYTLTPITTPLVQISNNECNVIVNIITNKHTIQTQKNDARTYEKN